ncbi:hypothetical protein Tco_1279414 [Tanacetum coccineum]
MAAPIIFISLDSFEERLGSHVSRVILFGAIHAVIPIIPEISSETHVISPVAPVIETTIVAPSTGLCDLVPYSDSDSDSPDDIPSQEYISPLPAISPFVSTDSSETSRDSSDGPPSQDPYEFVVARWRSKVASRPSPSSEFSIAPGAAPLWIRRRPTIFI